MIFIFSLHKGKPTLPANFEEETWAKLKSAICAIFLKQPNSCDLEKLYQVESTRNIFAWNKFVLLTENQFMFLSGC